MRQDTEMNNNMLDKDEEGVTNFKNYTTIDSSTIKVRCLSKYHYVHLA